MGLPFGKSGVGSVSPLVSGAAPGAVLDRYKPTPLQAWRQAADDVKYNRPVKNLLIRLRNAKPDDAFETYSYAECGLSEYETRIVANSLKQSLVVPVYRAHLKHLDLRNCDIDYPKAYYLARGLAGNVTLEHLNLRSNPLTAEGVREIMKALFASIRLLGDATLNQFDQFGRPIKKLKGPRGDHGRLTGSNAVNSSGNMRSPASAAHSSLSPTRDGSNHRRGEPASGAASSSPHGRTMSPGLRHHASRFDLSVASPNASSAMSDQHADGGGGSRSASPQNARLWHQHYGQQRDGEADAADALGSARDLPSARAHRAYRSAQLSPYLMVRAEKLVGVGLPPATPSTPRGSMPGRRQRSQQQQCQQAALGGFAAADPEGVVRQASNLQRGMTSGSMGFGPLDGDGRNSLQGHSSQAEVTITHGSDSIFPGIDSLIPGVGGILGTAAAAGLTPGQLLGPGLAERAAEHGLIGPEASQSTIDFDAGSPRRTLSGAFNSDAGFVQAQMHGGDRDASHVDGTTASYSTAVSVIESGASLRDAANTSQSVIKGGHPAVFSSVSTADRAAHLDRERKNRQHPSASEGFQAESASTPGLSSPYTRAKDPAQHILQEAAAAQQQHAPPDQPLEEQSPTFQTFRYTQPRSKGRAGPPIDHFTGQVVVHPLKYLNLANCMIAVPEKALESNLGGVKEVNEVALTSMGCDAIGEFLAHPSCGLQNLNISKNRLTETTCDKLFACLDANERVQVLGIHSTQAGPVAAAAFVSKALGLSLNHGRAALVDERLGVFAPPELEKEIRATDSLLATNMKNLLSGEARIGTGGSWLIQHNKNKIPSPGMHQPLVSPPLFEQASLSSALPQQGSTQLDAAGAGFPGDDHLSPSGIPLHILTSPARLQEHIREHPRQVHAAARDIFRRFLPSGPIDPASFSERVCGVRKLNLSHMCLGDVGALALAVILLAAHRSDEEWKGLLRQKQTKAAEVARRQRDANGRGDASVYGNATSSLRSPLVSPGFGARDAGVGIASGGVRSNVNLALQRPGFAHSLAAGDAPRSGLPAMQPVAAALAVTSPLGSATSTSLSSSSARQLSSSSSATSAAPLHPPLLSAMSSTSVDAAAIGRTIPMLSPKKSVRNLALSPIRQQHSSSTLTQLPSEASAAEKQVQLEWLKLKSNNIGPLALKALCRGLRLTQTLQKVDLSTNPLGSAGAHAIAEVMAHPSISIREFLLDNCRLTDGGKQFSGVHAILKGLTMNRTLFRLSLKANALVNQDMSYKRVAQTQEVTYSLKPLLAENRTLMFLDLRENGIKLAGQRAVMEAVAAFSFVVPFATEISALLTLWLDEHLHARHTRPGARFPSVPELLARPPSQAPLRSVYATLEGEAGTLVAAATRRSEDRASARSPARNLPASTSPSKIDSDAVARAVHLAAAVTSAAATTGTGTGAATSGAAQALAAREQREANHVIAAVASGSAAVSDPTTNKILQLSSLLGAAKSGTGTAAAALQFLIATEPTWMTEPPPARTAASGTTGGSAAAAAAVPAGGAQQPLRSLSPPNSRAGARPNSRQPSQQQQQSSSSPIPGLLGQQQKSFFASSSLSLLHSRGNMRGGLNPSNPSIQYSSYKSLSAVSDSNSLARGRSMGSKGSSRSLLRQSSSLLTMLKKRQYPYVVMKGQTVAPDIPGSLALARVFASNRQKQNRSSSSPPTALATGPAAPSNVGSRAASPDTGARPSTRATGATGANAASPAASRLPSRDGTSRLKPRDSDASRPSTRGTTGTSDSVSPIAYTEQEQPAATTSGDSSSAAPPVSDRDYVIVRGSKFVGEVAIPKLDFTKVGQYGGLAPQNAFFEAQDGSDDVYTYHAERAARLGIKPPIEVPLPYTQFAAQQALDDGISDAEAGVRASESTLNDDAAADEALASGNIRDRGRSNVKKPVRSFSREDDNAASGSHAPGAATEAVGAVAEQRVPSLRMGLRLGLSSGSLLAGASAAATAGNARPLSPPEAPRSLMRRQASLREILAATGKAAAGLLGQRGLNLDGVGDGEQDADIDGFAALESASSSELGANQEYDTRQAAADAVEQIISSKGVDDAVPSVGDDASSASNKQGTRAQRKVQARLAEREQNQSRNSRNKPFGASQARHSQNSSFDSVASTAGDSTTDMAGLGMAGGIQHPAGIGAMQSTGSRIRDAALGLPQLPAAEAGNPRFGAGARDDGDADSTITSLSTVSGSGALAAAISSTLPSFTAPGLTPSRHSSLHAAALGLPSPLLSRFPSNIFDAATGNSAESSGAVPQLVAEESDEDDDDDDGDYYEYATSGPRPDLPATQSNGDDTDAAGKGVVYDDAAAEGRPLQDANGPSPLRPVTSGPGHPPPSATEQSGSGAGSHSVSPSSAQQQQQQQQRASSARLIHSRGLVPIDISAALASMQTSPSTGLHQVHPPDDDAHGPQDTTVGDAMLGALARIHAQDSDDILRVDESAFKFDPSAWHPDPDPDAQADDVDGASSVAAAPKQVGNGISTTSAARMSGAARMLGGPFMQPSGLDLASSVGDSSIVLQSPAAYSPHSPSSLHQLQRSPNLYIRSPGLYSKTELSRASKKMLTPAARISFTSQRKSQGLRDAVSMPVHSLLHLRKNVINLVFEFLGERRVVLVS